MPSLHNSYKVFLVFKVGANKVPFAYQAMHVTLYLKKIAHDLHRRNIAVFGHYISWIHRYNERLNWSRCCCSLTSWRGKSEMKKLPATCVWNWKETERSGTQFSFLHRPNPCARDWCANHCQTQRCVRFRDGQNHHCLSSYLNSTLYELEAQKLGHGMVNMSDREKA